MMFPSTRVMATDVQGKGLGLFATTPIPRGTIVWARDALDRLFPPEAGEKLPAALRKRFRDHTFREPSGFAILHWDNALYVNHSCESNLTWLVDSWIEIASRDIEPGEELTEDYGRLNLPPDEVEPCLCGARSCRGVYSREVPAEVVTRWEAERAQASAHVSRVPQPLLDLLPPADRARISEHLTRALERSDWSAVSLRR